LKEAQALEHPWKKKEWLQVAWELQPRERQEALNQEASKVLGEPGVLVTPKELEA
jgi:hypothetical protein